MKCWDCGAVLDDYRPHCDACLKINQTHGIVPADVVRTSYPEKLKRTLAKKAQCDKERAFGVQKLTKLRKKLAALGFKSDFSYYEGEISGLEIRWSDFVGVKEAEEHLKPRDVESYDNW